jgi:hypothetical protein
MKPTFALAIVGTAVLVSILSAAQPPASQPPDAPQVRGAMPSLGRPTEGTDKTPPFDFDGYFNGTWNFEWIVPESALGPAGDISGTTTFKPIEGKFFSADTTAKGPGGAFKIHERIAYHTENRTIVRYVTDSRGFSYMSIAPVGSDLGGLYYMYFESEPFTYKGTSLRMKENWRLTSPLNYKVSITLSTDGGRFLNYGNPWWQKVGVK